jgi:hypothetical protein
VVRGLEKFRDWFADFEDCYVLVGGAASDLIMSDAGLEFRATKDLDIVLCVEALRRDFVAAFWQFVEAGGYQTRERSGGTREYFRFLKPTNDEFPVMLELFTRSLDLVPVPAGSRLTPIPADTDLSSLSAILMDDTYYDWVMVGRHSLNGVRVVGAAHLIPLKARAFLDLSERRARGEKVDAKEIRKHKNDVVRLLQTLPPVPVTGVPTVAAEDVARFAAALRLEGVNPASFGVDAFGGVDDVVVMLELVYEIQVQIR